MIEHPTFVILERDENFMFYLDDGKIIECRAEFQYFVLMFRMVEFGYENIINISLCKN